MIDVAIQFVAGQLNESLRSRFGAPDDMVVASSLLELDGGPAHEAANKLVVFLVNVERDTMPYRSRASAGGGERGVVTREPVYLNLLLMFAANFAGGHYREALKLLSATVGFFQARPVFDHASSPMLDERIEKLTVEIENLSIAELSNLWGILGSRYLPSMVYRLRMVVIDQQQVVEQTPRVLRPQTAVGA
jgi:hypothetical protein